MAYQLAGLPRRGLYKSRSLSTRMIGVGETLYFSAMWVIGVSSLCRVMMSDIWQSSKVRVCGFGRDPMRRFITPLSTPNLRPIAFKPIPESNIDRITSSWWSENLIRLWCLPLRILSCMLSFGVPKNRCDGFTHLGLSQVWQTNKSSGTGWYVSSYMIRWASRVVNCFRIRNEPYPLLFKLPVHNQQPGVLSMSFQKSSNVFAFIPRVYQLRLGG